MELLDTIEVNLQSVHGYLKCRCAYCFNSRGFTQAGFKANCMPLDIYHEMLNRGWSRFGNYYCKIDIAQSCCKVFPLRLDVTKFQISKSQKKSLKKWKKFLAGQNFKRKADITPNSINADIWRFCTGNVKDKCEIPEEHILDLKCDTPSKILRKDSELELKEKAIIHKALSKLLISIEEVNKSSFEHALSLPSNKGLKINEDCKKRIKLLKPRSQKYGDYYTNLFLIIYSSNKEKLNQIGIKDIGCFIKKIKGIILEILQPMIGKIEMNIQNNGYIAFTGYIWKSKIDDKVYKNKVIEADGHWFNILTPTMRSYSNEHEIIKRHHVFDKINTDNTDRKCINIEKYSSDQASGLIDEMPHPQKGTKELFCELIREQQIGLHGRKFEIKMEKPKFEREAFELYKKYCNDRHKGSSRDEKAYIQFMCMQALEYDKIENEGKELRLGCYHMKYYLEGKLIAVGVLDILPTCMYSVYFFYDPDIKHLSLGVVSILKEIEYMQEMQRYFPDFRYYHLGGYVQDSSKMAYKNEYQPAELLCPITYRWVQFNEEIQKKISNNIINLWGNEIKSSESMDFKGLDLDKFVKENIRINVRGATKLADLGEISPKYYIKVFKDITTALGKDIIKLFEFGIYE